MTAHHELFDGKLHVYRRERSRYWQCAATVDGKNFRSSTREESLKRAKDIAEDWFFGLKGKLRAGELKTGRSFKTAADQFRKEYAALTAGERNAKYVQDHWNRLRVHLEPFFGETLLSEITPGLVQDYRIHRMTSRVNAKTGEVMRPSKTTMHQEMVTLRLVLKTAIRRGWLEALPDLSAPYKSSGKISHRAWLSLEDYKRLYQATRERAANPPKPRWRWACEQLHDFVLFMGNTGLRPDEVWRLEFRDVEIVKDAARKEAILEISVRGKRGVGYCKSMPGAVRPFERLRDRPRPTNKQGRRMRCETDADASAWTKPEPTEKIFPFKHRVLWNTVLDELNLKCDREGAPRTAYSLRHTYISLRLMEGADIYQVAKNCRTSVEMIEKYYAAHIKHMIDAPAVNVRRPRTSQRGERGDGVGQRSKFGRDLKIGSEN